MRDTISEYARILIVMISFAMIMIFIFSGLWFGKLGEASDAIENKVVVARQDEVFDKLTDRDPPTIQVVGKTAHVGEVVSLYALINENVGGSYAVQDADGKNLANYVEIRCDSPDYNPKTEVLIPSESGVYKVTYKVRDSYGLSASRTINIVVR